MQIKQTSFKILPAFNGDCILIKTHTATNKEFIILIDGGTPSTFTYSLKKEIKNLSRIDLIILTHIDSDHIGGLIKFFKSSYAKTIEFNEIWVNHPDRIGANTSNLISFKEGNTLKSLIEKEFSRISMKQISTNSDSLIRDGIQFKILSPSEESLDNLYHKWNKFNFEKKNISSVKVNYDFSLKYLGEKKFKPSRSLHDDSTNASSIAFLLTCHDKSILLLADSRPEIIVNSLRKLGYSENNRLKCDYLKVSHHGSINNTSSELLDLVDCENYIISTNGNLNHGHPSREVIGRIVYNAKRDLNKTRRIFLNYTLDSVKSRIGNFVSDKDLNTANWEISNKNHF